MLSHGLGVHRCCHSSQLLLANPQQLLENHLAAPQPWASLSPSTTLGTGHGGKAGMSTFAISGMHRGSSHPGCPGGTNFIIISWSCLSKGQNAGVSGCMYMH